MKFTHKGLKINEYTKFISNGCMVEVIPDFTSDDKHPDVVIAVKDIQKMVSSYLRTTQNFEIHHIKIPVADITSRCPTITAEHDSGVSGTHIKYTFTGNVWTRHRCTIGTLEVEITDNAEEKEV